jgi:TIGR03009 family protein
MRHFWLVVAVLLLAGITTFGQQPQQQQQYPVQAPTLDPQNSRLDALLLDWEAKMKAVTSLKAQVSRQTEDPAFRTRTIFEGEAKYKKPNLAILDMRMRGRPDWIEKFVCTGNFVYQFVQDSKELRVHDLSPKPGQMSDDNFLSFLFEIKAAEAKKRYELSLFKEPDAYYYYLKIVPRSPADRAEFQEAKLALNRVTMLPRTLILIDPASRKTQWDIPVIDIGVNLQARDFEKPALPPGWSLKRMPKPSEIRPQGTDDLPPRIVRPKQSEK